MTKEAIRPRSKPELLDLGRLISLIDGVFAVALTLLVLDLKLPSADGDWPHALEQMLPRLLIYLVAFASIASQWTLHHRIFRLVRHGDLALDFLSLINLLFVTLMPASTSIVGAHPLDPIAAACFSTNSMLYCLSAWAIWSYVARNRRLLAEDADPQRPRGLARIMLLVALGSALAIPLAFLSAYLAYAIWILWWIPAAWLAPKRGSVAA